SECCRGCFDCQCRRRTCTNKILPAIIQIFIVIAVWTILKAQMMPDESTLLAEAQAEAAERYARSAQQFERDHNCSMGDYMRGSVLHVDGMLSAAHILAPDSNQKRPHFLSVDVLIRDVEEGTMVLYPVGTPINFGSLNIYYPGEEQAMQELLGESYGQVGSAGSNATGNETHVQFENPDDAATNFDVDTNRRFGAPQQPGPGVDRSRFPFGPQSQGQGPLGLLRGQMPAGSPQSRIGQMTSAQPGQPLQGRLPTGYPPSSESQSQSQPEDTVKPATPIAANLSTPNPIPAAPTGEPPSVTPASEGDISVEGDSTTENPVGEAGKDNTDKSETEAEGTEKPSTDSEASEKTTGGPAVDASLFAEGFEERLKKYKMELFGKESEDKGEDGSLTGTYRMNNPGICQKLETVDILYLVASKPQSMDVRDRIRQGYVNPTLFENVKMAHVFLVGLTNSPNFQKNLDTEKESYNDVVMGEYMDAPENSTLKALSGFRWARQYCKQAQHIFYVDESFFVDTDKLAHGLIPTADKVSEGKYMICPFMPSFPIPRQGPNAVKKPLFPTSTNFRPYCKSYAVLLSRSAMMSMIEASEQMAMFPAPDIYLFGYVPYLIGNMEVYDAGSKRAFHDFGQEVVSCYEEQKDRCPILASKASSARFETLFNMMKDRMKTTHVGWDGENTVWDLKSFKRII
ncbi:hypothetical protein EGW08_008895, partial [Elysia chlorotica]